MQEELLKDLLQTEKVYVVGILLVLVFVLSFVVVKLYNRINVLINEKTKQEKDSTIILNNLTDFLKRGQDTNIEIKENVKSIDVNLIDVKNKVSTNTTNVSELKNSIINKLLDM